MIFNKILTIGVNWIVGGGRGVKEVANDDVGVGTFVGAGPHKELPPSEMHT
jgi:hypothetical protein